MKLPLVTSLLLALSLSLSAHAVETKQATAQIDALIEKNYAPNDIKPNPITNDTTFVRRAYLDIIGRIPTADETRSFVSSMEPGKRSTLIDQLLNSEGYVSHQFNYWADILRLNSRLNGQDPANGSSYAAWIKNSLRENKPYDQFVTELITAEGLIDSNGAVGFYLRDRGMPLDHLATTVQVFLGTQMVCAQCHDHPFDDWTQMQYYQLAAFSSPMDIARNPPAINKAIAMVNQQSREKLLEANRERQAAKKNKAAKNEPDAAKARIDKLSRTAKATAKNLSQISYNFRNSAIGETDKPLKLPHDYQYDDAQPEQIVAPQTPFGDQITVATGESRIQAYAKWMTSPTNPRFTKTISNRLWKRVMGVGLFEPVDAITSSTEPTNPELLAYLEKLLIDLDYDLKAYYRVLYNTKTYQREATSVDPLTKFYYPGPRLRRMSAEQVWDSLITLIRPDADSASNPRGDYYASNTNRLDAWKLINSQSSEDLIKRSNELETFTKNSLAKVDQLRAAAEKSITAKNEKQAIEIARQLVKFNQEATKEYARLTYFDSNSFNNRYLQTPFRNTPTTLVSQLSKAFPKAKLPNERDLRIATMSAMMDTNSASSPQENEKEKLQRLRKQLSKEDFAKMQREAASQKARKRMKEYVRSSELSSPAPDGHFLRTFGQSDRQLIENANDEASVPQTLALMNGPLFRTIVDPHSEISKTINAAGQDNDAAIDAIYMSMLSRKATPTELSLLRTEFDNSNNRTDAIRGIVWTILNTQQFLFVE